MNEATIMGLAAATPYHDLQIPAVMGSVYLITKGVAFGLWVLFFYAEALRLKVQALRHALPGSSASKPRYGDFLWRALALFVCLAFLYQWTFLKMVSLCDHVSMLVSNEQQWEAVLAQLSAKSDTSLPLLHATMPMVVGAVAATALEYVQDVFIAIRFVILALLYCIGPIAWAFSISELGAGVLRGWFKNVWQVSFWLVMFSVVKAALIPLAVTALLAPADPSGAGSSSATILPIVYALVILAAMFMIPSITSAVFSEANLGAVASAAMAVVSYSSIRAAGANVDAAHGHYFGKDRIKTMDDVKGVYAKAKQAKENGESAENPAWTVAKGLGLGVLTDVYGLGKNALDKARSR